MMPLLSESEWKATSKGFSCNNLHASCRLQVYIQGYARILAI